MHNDPVMKYMKDQITNALRYLAETVPSDRTDLHNCLRMVDSGLLEFCNTMLADAKKEREENHAK
jgi:hypothetical protein